MAEEWFSATVLSRSALHFLLRVWSRYHKLKLKPITILPLLHVLGQMIFHFKVKARVGRNFDQHGLDF